MPRSILKVHSTSAFEKSFQKLPLNIQIVAERNDVWFRNNAFDPRLHTHKLKGELEGYWSYSIDYKRRVLFRFIKSDEVVYYDIGTHDVYK